MNTHYFKAATLACSVILLTACGGGSNPDPVQPPPPANQAPIANAGNALVVDEKSEVVLSGSGSDTDGTIVGYQWTQTSGTAVSLNDSAIANPQFTAPDLVSGSQTLSFELTVTDDGGATAKDSVNVSINNINVPPIAHAGESKTVDENSQVTLVGSGTDEDGTITTYLWTQTAGSAVTFSSNDTPTAAFIVPSVGVGSLTLSFDLTVTDNEGDSASDSVDVMVNTTNNAPTAYAGIDTFAIGGTQVQLQGIATDDDGTIASYSWTQVTGDSVDLINANSSSPSFTAPVTNADVSFKLQVTDDRGAVAQDSIMISITRYPQNPFDGATVQAGDKIVWKINSNDWTSDFRVESEVPVALSVTQYGYGVHERWLIAPAVSEPVEIKLILVDESDPIQGSVIDTVTVMPNDQIGFKQTLPSDNLYELGDFGEASGLKFELIDNDAFVDLVLTKNGKTSWFVGKGDGTFGADTLLLETTAATTPSIVFEDINKDGLKDLVLIYRGDNTRIVWHEKHFTPLTEFGPEKLIAQYPQNVSLNDYELADIDKDGALELISAYSLEGKWTLSMHQQLDDGQYGTESIIDHQTGADTALSITMAHLDEDGFLDIGLILKIFSTDYGSTTSHGDYLSRNNGSQFDIPETFNGQYGGDVQLNYVFDKDVNNDGVKDNFQVVTTTYFIGDFTQETCLSGFISNEVEGRVYQGDLICGANYLSRYRFIDVDGDGDLDLVFYRSYSNCWSCFDAKIISAGYLGFFENNGSRFIKAAKVILYAPSSPQFIGADYDGDADQDIFIWQGGLGCDECTFEWYQQTK